MTEKQFDELVGKLMVGNDNDRLISEQIEFDKKGVKISVAGEAVRKRAANSLDRFVSEMGLKVLPLVEEK